MAGSNLEFTLQGHSKTIAGKSQTHGIQDSVSRSPLAKGAKFSTPQKCVEHHALCEAQVQTFESCYYAELAFEKVKQTITQIYAMLEYLLPPI